MNEAVKALLAARGTAADYREQQLARAPEIEADLEKCRSEITRMESRIKEIDQALAKLGHKEKNDGNAA